MICKEKTSSRTSTSQSVVLNPKLPLKTMKPEKKTLKSTGKNSNIITANSWSLLTNLKKLNWLNKTKIRPPGEFKIMPGTFLISWKNNLNRKTPPSSNSKKTIKKYKKFTKITNWMSSTKISLSRFPWPSRRQTSTQPFWKKRKNNPTRWLTQKKRNKNLKKSEERNRKMSLPSKTPSSPTPAKELTTLSNPSGRKDKWSNSPDTRSKQI